MVVGHGRISAPDLAEAHVTDVLSLLRTRASRPLTREDVAAMIADLRRAVGVLHEVRDAYPGEAEVAARDAAARRFSAEGG